MQDTAPTPDPVLGDRFQQALVHAARLHALQTRKGGRIPYVSHLLGVASLVLEDGGSEDEAIAALLHDSIEDQGETVESLTARFGPAVAGVVDECTGPMGDENGSWRERHRAIVDAVPEATLSARRVELADKLHNARSILADYRRVGDELWTRFNATGRDDVLWYYRSLAEAFRRTGDGFLVDELERTVRTVHDEAGVAWPAGAGH